VDFPLVFVGGRLDGLVELEVRHPARLFGPRGEYEFQRAADGCVWCRAVELIDPSEANDRLQRILAHATAAWVNEEAYRRYPTRPPRDQGDSEVRPP
jgi:hypothetical protein